VIRIVAGREIRERLRAKSFYALTALLVVIILAGGVIARLAVDDGPSTIGLAVTEPVPERFGATVDAIAELLDREVEVTAVPDAAAARAALDAGDVDVAVIEPDHRLLHDGDLDQRTEAIVQQAWAIVSGLQSLTDAGLSADQIQSALNPAPLAATNVDEDDETDPASIVTGTMAAILLFISLQTFGGYVLLGVVEEKSSAVVEVLLARARADELLAGKVIGIGVAALVQFTIAVAAALVSLMISGRDIPGEVWGAVPTTIVWFLGGYAFYSTLYALAGSLVSRQEDAQAAAAPILSLLMAGYLFVLLFGYESSAVLTGLSLFPPTAPLTMPMRMAGGDAPLWQVGLSLVLLATAIGLVWKAASRIFEQVLLRKGSRISWKEALKLRA
jgi:ABC-2 type transport system permease protein